MREFGSIIGGKEAFSGEWIEIHNPYSGATIGRVAAAGQSTTVSVIEQTRCARLNLARHLRAEILNKMAARIEAERNEVSLMITDETGLARKDALYEVSRASDVFRFAAIQCLLDDSETFPCDVSRGGKARRIYTMRQPWNLIVAITPFNHPLNQVAHKVAPAIATNNTVILKPSLQTPLSAHYVGKVALECGLPGDALNVICGSTIEVAETLVRSNAVDMITFTGSSAAGQRSVEIAGFSAWSVNWWPARPCSSFPMPKSKQAVEISMAGIYKNSGQRCTAIRRLLVHDSIAASIQVC